MEGLVRDIAQNNRQIKKLLGYQNDQRYNSLLPDFDVSLDTDRILETLLGEDTG